MCFSDLWNRATTFVVLEPQPTATNALIKLPRTDDTDALLSGHGLDFGYDRFRGRYRLRLGKGDVAIYARLLIDLMKRAQRVAAE